ncbi:hypothetical protein COCC4DRAFT_61906 [Bipolaris maydis ATCC 48331]|uniref:Uncharacterized protein n=2 Tax=Cochliobolus heterostrophus TaxID=5016 RepID=M2UGK3_COCH5|nr:uncharacterized protein COCC4DRAFT_61906 [Bipolaris maydis ATCC 48331]EMD87118.1 hypothetical protein COCHEDRAFT_1160229 [Bipolaris maydis C5]ENI03888.1 hypothetical protein COCC4DRAFT_61906 [Bipolaris maydis ATCC 48331]KAJ6204427.1 hypothetical protein PSV09DRAFT_1160229 [Bipolaris maydis]
MIRRRCRRPRLDWILAVSWTDLTEMRSSEHRHRSTRRGWVSWLTIGLLTTWPLFSPRHIPVLPAIAQIHRSA